MTMFSRASVITQPDAIADIKAEAKKTLELIVHCERLQQLRKYNDWGRFEWSYMCTWANPVDEPFIKLMLSLSKHKYDYGAISMHRWWRRLKAVNQQNVITFFTYVNFKKQPGDGQLYWYDVYQQCCKTAETFAKMDAVYRDDTFVEMNLRALLGISQQRDIKDAWKEFAKTNHPDKGGSVEKFVLVKAAYEEWLLNAKA